MNFAAIFRPPKDSENRYLFLLSWMVGFILLSAFTHDARRPSIFLALVFFGILLATLRVVSRSMMEFSVAAALGVADMAFLIHGIVTGEPTWISDALAAAFMGFISLVVLREVLQEGAIGGDKIRGAICAYLFIGLSWAYTYAVIDHQIPGSFVFPEPGHAGIVQERPPYIYLSFVTLTTLGYGDILPTTQLTRTLCWMEAVFGQLYLAVLVARLVGMYQIKEPTKE